MLLLGMSFSSPGCDTVCPADAPMRPTDPVVLAMGGYQVYEKAMDLYKRGIWDDDLSDQYNQRLRDLRTQGEQLQQDTIGINAISEPLTSQAIQRLTAGTQRRRGGTALEVPVRGGALVAGGFRQSVGHVVGSTFLFDGNTETWSRLGELNHPREGHTLTQLMDGRVLAVGGTDFQQTIFTQAEALSPDSGTWSPAGTTTEPHLGHSATLLNGGRVLVVGGVNTLVDTPDFGDRLAGAELFDPDTNEFSAGPEPQMRRTEHRAVKLLDGKVLVVAGFSSPTVGQTAELYNPVTNEFVATANQMSVDHGSGATATLLADGRVLVAGGQSSALVNGSNVIAKTDLYDPATNSFSPGPDMGTSRQGHQAVLMPDGTVLVIGGQTEVITDDSTESVDLDTSETYDPVANTFTPSATKMAAPRYQFTAVVVP
ncbi:MAG: kelch repeat-containing protein [Phycisphaerae bacterium]